MGVGMSEWQVRKARIEERIRNEVREEFRRNIIKQGTSKDPAPPRRIVADTEVAQRMETIETYAEKARKAVLKGEANTTANLLYEIALLADYQMTPPAPRARMTEGTSEDRSIAKRGGGID